MVRIATAVLVAAALAPTGALAQDSCRPDADCRFKKPNVLVVLDYSSSMVGFENAPAYFPPGQTVETRWDAQLDAVSWILRYDDGFFADNVRIALARFAHDPEVDVDGTVLTTDASFPPITDGFAVDVPFDGSDGAYLECKASAVEAEIEVMRSQPPPWIDQGLDPTRIMLTWTRGALRSAHDLIEATRAAHAGDPGEDERVYEVVLMTDGDWTCPDMIGQGCDEDPADEAAILRADGIRVHVVAFGDATMQPSLDEVALQGGTGASIDATSPKGIIEALGRVLDGIRDSVIVPSCTRAFPRVQVIVDGSSSMIEGSAPGETIWDKARFALAGNPAAPDPGDPGYVEPVFSREIDLGGRPVAIEDVVHLGLATFSTADDQRELVRFGPCMRDNFEWSMDPFTSCEAPGCTDPYGGYPIEWTFKDSDDDRDPPFVQTTRSYMPACNETPMSASCVGQIPNTFTGEGLTFARERIEAYRADPAPYFADDATPFVNVLITDGRTSMGSVGAATELQAMAADGVSTYVIGFGDAADLDEAQLDAYASAGGTGSAIVVDPAGGGGADALADALQSILAGIALDPCCVLDDCSSAPEPTEPGAVCGDGRIEGAEVCDDGLDNATYDRCAATCDGPHLFCGDGRLDGPEECDPAAPGVNDVCTDDCAFTDADAGASPGSGVVDDPARTGPRLGGGEVPDGGAFDAAFGGEDTGLDGCGCRLAGRPRASLAAWLLCAAALMLASTRARRTGTRQSSVAWAGRHERGAVGFEERAEPAPAGEHAPQKAMADRDVDRGPGDAA